MANFLVTGATGFIGNALTDELIEQKQTVFVLANKNSPNLSLLQNKKVHLICFEYFEQIPDLLAKLEIDVVFHLATLYIKSDALQKTKGLIDSNITYGTYLLEGIKNKNIKFVLAQSFFQFEQNKSSPKNLYAATKQAFTEIAGYYSKSFDFPLIEVVLFETYGPNDNRNKLIPNLIAANNNNEQFFQIQNRNTLLNLVHISDVVAALIRAGDYKTSSIFSVKPDTPVPITFLIDEINSIIENPIEFRFINDHQFENPNSSGDWPSPPGWSPKISLSEGVRKCF